MCLTFKSQCINNFNDKTSQKTTRRKNKKTKNIQSELEIQDKKQNLNRKQNQQRNSNYKNNKRNKYSKR